MTPEMLEHYLPRPVTPKALADAVLGMHHAWVEKFKMEEGEVKIVDLPGNEFIHIKWTGPKKVAP